MDECLTEDVVAALVDGALDEVRFAVAERHIGECERCMLLVEQVGRALATGVAAGTAGDEVAPLARGARVGRYEVLEPIGAGGMGRVYAAQDPALDRKVALKLLHPSSTTPDLEARLLREAKAMARLSHPEVITIHDVGHHGEQLFIAMELVDGGTLRQWLAAAPRPWREVLAVFLRAGRGLARAHAAGIIHRDFKPDNVLVGSDGRVRVTDFGLARTGSAPEPVPPDSPTAPPDETTLTRTGALMGTPAYMAPEQHAGAAADARSDIYSFCVALYEGLYGERPFMAGTLGGLQVEKLAGPAPKPRTERRVPKRLLRPILAGLRPRPEERYESMDALLEALEGAARAPRWPIALAALAVLAAGGGVTLVARRAQSIVPAVAKAGAALECANNRACVESHGGAPFVCRPDHTCAPVASEDCVAKFEPQDLAAEDTVWFGAMFPMKGLGAEDFGIMNMEAVDFARGEIAQATKAFGGPGAPQRVRRIALVECDDSADAARAARHLVDDVGVPAVLGFRSGQEVVDLAGSLFIGRNVVTVATLTSSPLITRLPQQEGGPRLVWRTTYDLDAVADVIARVIEQVLMPRYGEDPVHVTLVRADTPGALSFADKLYRTLRFDGKPAIASAGSYAEVRVRPGTASTEEIARVADRVVDTKPSVVVLQGDASIAPVLERVELRMASAPRKPSYLGVLYTTDTFAPFMGRSLDRRHRVYTIESLSSSVPNARFVTRYNEAYAKNVTLTVNGGASYDAFFLLAYATFAVGRAPVDGPAIAHAFARLVGPGRSIAVGPSDVFDGLATLGRGESIDLEGTQSGLDFDLATGDEPSDFALLCSGVDATGRATGEDIESGVFFRAATKKLEGSLKGCP